jgi:endonuclease-3 related protein
VFEIVIGAILTQNTSWKNVEKTIEQLNLKNMLTPPALAGADPEDIATLIRSSGYYNQKTKKLKILAQYFFKEKFLEKGMHPGRSELLSLWGIGPETADSILLYAFGEPYFVVDAYTKRLLSRLGCISGNESYDEIQDYFTAGKRTPKCMSTVHYYNEYHALIVEHAKQHCRKKPACPGCPVWKFCGHDSK